MPIPDPAENDAITISLAYRLLPRLWLRKTAPIGRFAMGAPNFKNKYV